MKLTNCSSKKPTSHSDSQVKQWLVHWFRFLFLIELLCYCVLQNCLCSDITSQSRHLHFVSKGWDCHLFRSPHQSNRSSFPPSWQEGRVVIHGDWTHSCTRVEKQKGCRHTSCGSCLCEYCRNLRNAFWGRSWSRAADVTVDEGSRYQEQKERDHCWRSERYRRFCIELN